MLTSYQLVNEFQSIDSNMYVGELLSKKYFRENCLMQIKANANAAGRHAGQLSMFSHIFEKQLHFYHY